MFVLNPTLAKHRYEEMLREAEQARHARRVARANGAEPLLSRMVKLLTRSSRPSQKSVRAEGA